MAIPELPDDMPWYAHRGIPIGIIIYLVIVTITGTAWLTNLADRVAFMESDRPTHDEISNRLIAIETQLKLIIRGHKESSSNNNK